MKRELSREIVKNKLDQLDFSQPLSFRTILKRTRINEKQINKNYMLGYLYKSGEYRKIKPLEIGSGKHKINDWEKV